MKYVNNEFNDVKEFVSVNNFEQLTIKNFWKHYKNWKKENAKKYEKYLKNIKDKDLVVEVESINFYLHNLKINNKPEVAVNLAIYDSLKEPLIYFTYWFNLKNEKENHLIFGLVAEQRKIKIK